MNLVFLLRSRKFWIAAVTIVSLVLMAMGREELPVERIADSIATIAAVLIGSIAAEDMARKLAGGSE